jgi:hypothetical protein
LIVQLTLGGLKQAHWYEFVLRFALGGAITVASALISRRWGPVVGGLFLAFPVIFPAGATLIERHETERKRKAGIQCERRGRKAAAVDAAGAKLGACALAGFAAVAMSASSHPSAWTLAVAALTWATIAGALWWLRHHHVPERWLRNPRRHG